MQAKSNIGLIDEFPEGAELFSEIPAWRSVGAGWSQLHGSFQKQGVSFEWHDFKTRDAFNWAESFHPGSVELCLNLTGNAHVSTKTVKAEYSAGTAGFYCHGPEEIEASRHAQEQHRFITVEFSPVFLRDHLQGHEKVVHPLIKRIVEKPQVLSAVGPTSPLTSRQQHLVNALRHPPVMLAAQKLWYHSKALELIVEFFFQAPADDELFCARQQRVDKERVEKTTEVLRTHLAEPPTLTEIGRLVGCSPFYLSRTFSKEMLMTIPQYLRRLRMEKAAELLKSGKFNVTEVALQVGYSSLSHFSATFHQTYGCCPGLYPIGPNHLTSFLKKKNK